MRLSQKSLWFSFLCSMIAAQTSAYSQTPREIPGSAVAQEVRDAKEVIELIGLQESLTVSGDQVSDAYFVGAKTLVFEPNSRLIFSSAAVKRRRNLIVMAPKIVQKDPMKPGTITWARGEGPSNPPPVAGQAATGTPGAGQGHPGNPGANGAPGNKGLDGEDAPSLTLFFIRLEGAPPILDFEGQKGGKGGTGQQGGSGGSGREGRPAANSAVDCKRGPGAGGPGGPGGAGGKGGIGGTGGDGGTVTLVSVPDVFPAALQLIRAVVQGGAGGAVGDGGPKGVGGPGGGGAGPIAPHCRGQGANGPQGPDGALGLAGDPGEAGSQGDILFTALPRDKMTGLGL